MSDDIELQVEEAVRRLDEKLNRGTSVRDKIINKLSLIVDEMDIKPNVEKASDLEAKMTVVNTLLKAVNDEENQRVHVIKVKQSLKKDKETNDALNSIGSIVTEYLKNITPLIIPSSGNIIDHEKTLNDNVDVEELGILDGELEIGVKTIEEDQV